MSPSYSVIGTPKYSYICAPLVNRINRVRLTGSYPIPAMALERTGVSFMESPFVSVSDRCRFECTHFVDSPPFSEGPNPWRPDPDDDRVPIGPGDTIHFPLLLIHDLQYGEAGSNRHA